MQKVAFISQIFDNGNQYKTGMIKMSDWQNLAYYIIVIDINNLTNLSH